MNRGPHGNSASVGERYGRAEQADLLQVVDVLGRAFRMLVAGELGSGRPTRQAHEQEQQGAAEVRGRARSQRSCLSCRERQHSPTCEHTCIRA